MIRTSDNEGHLITLREKEKHIIAEYLNRDFADGGKGKPSIVTPAGADPSHVYPIGLTHVKNYMDPIQATSTFPKPSRYDLPPPGSNHDGHSIPLDAETRHLTPKGLKTLKPAMSFDEYLITRVTAVPVSGEIAHSGDTITLPAHLTSENQILLPCFGVAFSVRNLRSSLADFSYMDRGSWIFFRETRTFIDGTEIERLDHANIVHSFEVYRNRKDTYVSNSNDANNTTKHTQHLSLIHI